MYCKPAMQTIMFFNNNHYWCSSGVIPSFPWPWLWFLYCHLSITRTCSCLPLKLIQQRRNESSNKEHFQDNACKIRSILACHLETSQGSKCEGKQGRMEKETGARTLIKETTYQDGHANRKRKPFRSRKGYLSVFSQSASIKTTGEK